MTHLVRGWASRHLGNRGRAIRALMFVPALTAYAGSAAAQGNIASVEGDGGDLRWMADANVGALKAGDSELQAAGDISAGIGQESWGVTGWGSGSAYEIASGEVESDTTRLEGSGDAWLTLGHKQDVISLVLRATGGGVNYSSTVFDRTGTGSFEDETSWMGRGSLFVGGLLRPDDSFAAYLAVGGGIQFEWYDTTSASAATTTTLNDTQDLSFIGSARFEMRWQLAPDVLSLRLRSSAVRFKLSRSNELITAGEGPATLESTVTSFNQLEVSSRALVDIDAAAFYGFRPSLHGGVDYVQLSGGGESLSTTSPVFGAGLTHPWM